MDKKRLNSLYLDLNSYQLDEDIDSLVNPSSLSREGLKFLGLLIDSFGPKRVLEFGTGISTLFFARKLGQDHAAGIYSVDHSPHYLKKTKETLGDAENIHLFLCPISAYRFRLKSFATYSDEYLHTLPGGMRFDLVLIDGPPGYKYGREAMLYQIAPFIHGETLIVLDDANREREQEAISSWKRVWGEAMDVVLFPGLKKGMALIQIEDPGCIPLFPFRIREILSSMRDTKSALKTISGGGSES